MASPGIILSRANIRAKKSLGQHFLSDPDFAEKIVSSAKISSDDTALEIGPGLGALTFSLARRAGKVYAVDKDRRIVSALRSELKRKNISNVVLIEDDILKFDISNVSKIANRKLTVFGNLPYNISSQILVKLINEKRMISCAVLMFQKEMAQRIMAEPGGKDYGRLSVMLRYCADIKKVATAKAGLFFPKPGVDSTALRIEFKKAPEHLADNELIFRRTVKAAFSKRRKILKNALSGSCFNIGPEEAVEVLEGAGIDPVRRAETLTIEEFVKLGNGIGKLNI